MATFAQVILRARDSYNSSYCTVDDKWRLHQLHSLHRLVRDNRDALVSALAAKHDTHAWIYEREVGTLVKELHSHITSLEHPKAENSIRKRPVGVAVIVCSDTNPLRYGLAPAAAAIAAGNIVVLAITPSPDNPFVSNLQRLWRKYMDIETVFFVPGVEVASLDHESIDHISIFDRDPSPYSTILQHPNAHFHLVSAGYNIAIIAMGQKNWEITADEIISHSMSQRLPSDRLSAVFVRQEDVSDCKAAIVTAMKNHPQPTRFEDNKKEPKGYGISSWGSDVWQLDLTTPDQQSSLNDALQSVTESGGLLFIISTSLEQSIDILIDLDKPIQHLSLLAASHPKEIPYVKDWIKAYSFSDGHISTNLRPIFDSFVSTDSSTAIFPTALFSRSQVIVDKAISNRSTVTADIRALYETLIAPPRPEPRGERMGFFSQVEILVKGVALSVVSLSAVGLYFGFRSWRRGRI